MGSTVAELFLSVASREPERVAVVDGERTLTYGQLAGLALKLAAYLESRREGERVALLLPTSNAFAASFLGVALSGRVPVPLNLFLTPEELHAVVGDSGVSTIITTGYFAELARALPAEALLAEELLPSAMAMAPAAPASPHPIATLLYTSGTTGAPRGVVLSQRNIAANVRGCVDHSRLTADDVFLGVLPLFHTFALTTTLALPLSIGARAVMMPRFDPAGALAAIERHRATAVFAVPSMYRAMARGLERGGCDISSLRLPVSGGEPLPAEVLATYERCGVRLLEGYGLTETSPVVACNLPWAFKAGTVGRPLPNVEVRVIDDEGRPVSADADGEILVRAESVMECYHNRPDETQAAVTCDGFLRTGDIGRIDEEGFIRITGRKKELIICAGENVFPGEVERALLRHPAVAEAAVIGIADRVRGEAPKAFVVLREGATATPEELREFCRGCIARYKVPAEVEFRSEFPRSPTGKILKRGLVEQACVEKKA